MSIFRSYFSKNNTIQKTSFVNTGRNPVMQLFYGTSLQTTAPNGFTRFIFDLDLDPLLENIASGVISTGCTSAMTHTLKMTNTSSFDIDLLNTEASDQSIRATSFDLILFRIPKSSGSTGNTQTWDEGVGYDYVDTPALDSWGYNKNFSTRPSNWYQMTTLDNWSQQGLYSNTNSGNVNYSGLTIVATQHFELGNEDVEMDMTNEINSIIDGTLTGVTGWGLAYVPQLERITGLTDSYSVAFFSRHTQTFYQPFLLTNYDDLIQDDRNKFLKNQTNKLYLYVYQNGNPVNLDDNPTVKIEDANGNVVSSMSSLTTCLRTRGVYEVVVPNSFTGSPTPCMYYDVWENLVINGQPIANITNQFILQQYSAGIQIGTSSREPEKFGFDFYGILQNEKILNSDIRKVGVTIKKAYTGQVPLENISAFYRVYVKEGTTEVQVQDWTPINRTPNEYYFIFDMRDKIPNQYFVDIQVNTSGEKDTYKRELTFEIVNKK